ncbi:MAG: permease prefix domain 1-containing protein [Clostridiales Family XIII bacterium]|jgi:hypothetical protein|nr:permease prefix domain 1-containing protein [Clostridiales Family XIII bacterium]
MNTQAYIDALFADYEQNAALADFKEELRNHLDERIADLAKGGVGERDAFDKATKELGDMSAAADEVSRRKKQEVLSEMYMQTRRYMSAWRIALFVLCGTAVGFGIIVVILSQLVSGTVLAPIGTTLFFVGIPVIALVFLALTQETAVREAMGTKRALLYVAASALFLFGVFASLLTYFAEGAGLMQAVASLIPFALPGAAFGVFLILTEKDRSKPWVRARRAAHMKRERERFGNPAAEERFGLFSGALWIAALAAFALLTMLFGLKFSWIALIAALIGQMLVLAGFTKVKSE